MVAGKGLIGVVGLALLGMVMGWGCGDSTGETLGGGHGGGAGFTASSGGGGGLGIGVCQPACQPPQFCSAANECIDQGTCLQDEDCSGGTVCDQSTSVCVPGGQCGAQEFPITAQPPNMLIVLDRTGSMDNDVPGSGGKSRWQVASEAVASVLQSHAGLINFGLDLFSACTGNGCAPGTIVQPIGSTAAAINQSIAQASLCFSGHPETVIGASLQVLVGEGSLQVPGRDNVVLLITDGHDNCGGGGAQAAAALLAQAVPVPVYVVGFSGGVNAAELDAIAQAAGTAPYYQADDATQLNAALDTIASSVATCTFVLDSPPDGAIYVFFNNDPAGVQNDSANGWSYDPATKTLTFHGAACDQIKDGQVDDIDVVFGCAAPTPD